MANAKLGTKAVGSIVKLKVGGTAKEFIVVHQGKPSSIYDESCNGTWLLMKDIYENRQWSNVNNLENSSIHSYLNATFLGLFDSDIQKAIKQVKIPYRKNGGSGGTDQSGANGLSTKIFLLSGYEVGFTTSDNQYFPQDGAKLSYFESGTGTSANNKRIAYLNGSATSWWLRSPIVDETGSVLGVFSNGSYYYGSVSSFYGIRPALVLPQDMEVDSSGNVTPPPPATHKTLVNGTAYDVKGGKCLVNGTVYNILKGRTLIGGTGYDINFEPDVSLTWYFNQTLSIPVSTTSTTFSTRAHYEGGSKTITGIQIINRGDNPNMSYLGSGFASTAWDQRRGWRDTAYRTITFDEAPSGDLLAWLQENATPQ